MCAAVRLDCNRNGLMQGGSFKWAVECLKCGLILGPFETERSRSTMEHPRADSERGGDRDAGGME